MASETWTASCAVGSELGFLFTFHESLEPVNPACKALGLMFYYTSDSPALQPTPCLQSYCWTLRFTFPDHRGRPHCLTSRRGVSDYVFKCECTCVGECVRLHARSCLHIISRGAIEWRDELWSMSCRQNTSDLVESESPDGAGPFQATGAGRRCTKSALSLSGTPRGLLHGPRSPRQHPAN